jgi:hypothetical protein
LNLGMTADSRHISSESQVDKVELLLSH